MGRAQDWPTLLLELRAHGFSQYAVAAAINVSRSTVSAWADGTEPRFSEGLALVRLHAHVVERRKTPQRFAVRVA
jgi:predicted transcriptional regulator